MPNPSKVARLFKPWVEWVFNPFRNPSELTALHGRGHRTGYKPIVSMDQEAVLRWHSVLVKAVTLRKVRAIVLLSTLVLMGCQRQSSPVVTGARDARSLPQVCKDVKVTYPPKSLFFRAFKVEKELEIWAEGTKNTMVLLRTYPIAAASGTPGPKRRQGDLQVPEGVYKVDRFNPNSMFHLSLGLNYPNASDRILGDKADPGSDIFIHGNEVSIGCMAMTDEKIEEIYDLATKAKRAITVHIFPCRMSGNAYAAIKRDYPQHRTFWTQLEPIYLAFEDTKRVPKVSIDSKGRYKLK